ncbi:hypothetical protein BRCON_1091 [Candidatus Sumerlaea chitinivorans]|uniref:Uncharacterized protein n=1 Tax=Sumerlaea chitinivorans TaxID=2250252 RepID=A0A2Z4Y4R0_SUMC1|nr:hypothetical protein BRCON_1091 [Candidatus Sumerlaea chitinivorans]
MAEAARKSLTGVAAPPKKIGRTKFLRYTREWSLDFDRLRKSP